MPKTFVFDMAMSCESCANAARRVLGKLGEGAVDIESIDPATKKIVLHSDLPSETILEALKKTGKQVTLVEER